jgi:hypothetical protein
MTVTNKWLLISESRWFESMYTLQGKTRSTRHTLSTLDLHRVPDHTSHVVYVGNLSLVLTRIKHAPTPRRSLSDRRQTGPARVTSFPLPHDSLGVGERGFGHMVTQLHQLTRSITPACDRYVQYLLAEANPSVLNRHRLGLPPWRCRLSTHHSLTFLTDGPPPLPLKGHARSPIYPKSIN